MDEVRFDDMFARFEAETSGTFRPVPLAEVQQRVLRRRWWRRGALAGLLAAALAAPAGALAVADRRAGPAPIPPGPVVSPSASPSPAHSLGRASSEQPIERRATL